MTKTSFVSGLILQVLNHVLGGELASILIIRYDKCVVFACDANVANYDWYVCLVRFVDDRRQCCRLNG